MDNWTCIGVKLEQPQDDVWNKRDLSSSPTQSPRLKNHLLCNFKKYNYCILRKLFVDWKSVDFAGNKFFFDSNPR